MGGISLAAVAALFITGLAGCSSGAGAQSPASAQSPQQSTGPNVTVHLGPCVDASRDVLAQIEVGARPGPGLRLESGAAVQARGGVYVLAGRVHGRSGPAATAVWTVVSLDGRAAPILVADENASTYSTWVSVEEFPQYGVPLDSPAIAAARDCLDG